MFNKGRTKYLLTLGGTAAVLWMGLSINSVPIDPICQFQPSTQFNASLPASHVDNQCAVDTAAQVSWFSWFFGKPETYQFHFLDLLELLNRDANSDFSSGRE
ncbi:hypothetical protein [Alteromonas sp. ASW11-130]|uniref:hypothetical protein n=1 Tax=Alteromonas sp. ASW11-130 TaxID=3015775 RepID=UPI002241A459|nr:hypothetical protein [Alteromonas sp. ASW11-130]MCW8090935.1 hypothetical protein [Alteromonas sp. ASW11-130]